MVQDVKSMYNAKYPFDHADDLECEMGCDEEGLLWVETTGQGIEHSQIEKLEDMLGEVKHLYNQKYPFDHVDESDRDVGYDADGLLWVQYTRQGIQTQKVDKLQELLQEVKNLYNEKYPHDNVDEDGHEVGRDSDGLLWVRYTGDGAETRVIEEEASVKQLEDLLEEVKGLYNSKYPLDHIEDSGHEAGCDSDGLTWVKFTGQGRSQLDKLQDMLQDVKSMYNAKYPFDHADDLECEMGCDEEGLLWVETTGQGIEHSQIEKLEDMLGEVKHLYNQKYPFDHVGESDRDVGYDADGLLWVQYTGQGIQTQKVDELHELLQEVKNLYNEKYPHEAILATV